MVRVAARALAMAATEANATRTQMSRADASLTGSGGWTGEAAHQFSDAVLGTGTAFDAYASVCAKASQTLTAYANDLAAVHAAVEHANALAEAAGATLDDEGFIVRTIPDVPTLGPTRDPVADAAAQNAGREAMVDFKNATRRTIAGLHDARHALMPQYGASAPSGFSYVDWAVGMYTAGVAVSGAPEYAALRKFSRRRSQYWREKVGETKGARFAKFFADRAKARAERFGQTAKAAKKMAEWPAARFLAMEMEEIPGARAVPVLKRVPVLGAVASVGGTALEIKQGEEPVTAISATLGSIVAGTVATQFAAAGLVALGMAGGAPVIVGAIAGAAVAWGVGEGIKWLAHTQAGQDAIAGAKEFVGDVGENVSDVTRAIGERLGTLGKGLRSLLR